MSKVTAIKSSILALSNLEKATILLSFFKTGPGQYGEGDKFLGVSVPDCRSVAKSCYKDMSIKEVVPLLDSDFHEERLVGLLILVMMFDKSDEKTKKEIFDLYLNKTDRINNWDLVDLTAPKIVGKYIYDNQKYLPILDKLSSSKLLWDKRIAVISTFHFLYQGDPVPTLKIVEKLLTDDHDLIQKANGWMLREMGKRVDEMLLIEFLKEHYDQVPRTTLRYAIEKFNRSTRSRFLTGKFN